MRIIPFCQPMAPGASPAQPALWEVLELGLVWIRWNAVLSVPSLIPLSAGEECCCLLRNFGLAAGLLLLLRFEFSLDFGMRFIKFFLQLSESLMSCDKLCGRWAHLGLGNKLRQRLWLGP